MKPPKNWSDLTLGQLQVALSDASDIVKTAALLKISEAKARELTPVEIEAVLSAFNGLTETAIHRNTFRMNGVEYGFVNDWGEFSIGEWIDCEKYQSEFWPNAHRLMSVLYRPVRMRGGDKYVIAKYTAKENADVFKQMPADLFSGAMLFFWNIRAQRLQTLIHCLLETEAEAMRSLSNGVGIRQSSNWRKTISGGLKKLRNYQHTLSFNILRTLRITPNN
jgi:hypothetical protein